MVLLPVRARGHANRYSPAQEFGTEHRIATAPSPMRASPGMKMMVPPQEISAARLLIPSAEEAELYVPNTMMSESMQVCGRVHGE